MTNDKRTFVLDTNVLMHDPSALFRFAEHDIFLPMTVLEELDAAKKGMSEVARNARQTSRFINDLMEASDNTIDQGVPLRHPDWRSAHHEQATGNLWFETEPARGPSSAQDQRVADNRILRSTLALRDEGRNGEVVLVSKDINLRIKATICGLPAEDYQNDRALDDLSMLYSGSGDLAQNFWSEGEDLKSWTEGSRTFYEVVHEDAQDWYPNQFLHLPDPEGAEAQVQSVDGNRAVLRIVNDYRNDGLNVWGITARNREQNFALNLLMDDRIDFVTLMGTAGTGKTLLSLAAGLVQTLEEKRFSEIIMTRATVPVGEDIGFLPGTEEEKMGPWMGALADNLEFLTGKVDNGGWERAATNDIISSRIKIRSLNFMRGRTFLNRFVIIDEAQNLTSKQMKTLLTRAGPGTKMVCLGNVEQIDTPYLTETTSGLTFAVDRFKAWEHGGHITLTRGERSRLADYASQML
ncbi:MAG: PhoH family protein [Pseudomonadota bacterium]